MAERRAIHYSGYERKAGELYATPAWVTRALLRAVPLRGPLDAVRGSHRRRRAAVRRAHAVTALARSSTEA